MAVQAESLEVTKGELATVVGSLARQMYLAVLGQTAVMLGFTYFLVTQLR
jgi:hypothetical protein